MQKEITPKHRLSSLDGLRGFAAIMVFLSHFLALEVFSVAYANSYVGYVKELLVNSGVVAVGILFVLCGFFMGLLYEDVADPYEFIKKRYTRIFPLFITVTVVFLLNSTFGFFGSWATLILILLLGYGINLVWNQMKKNQKASSSLFALFLLFQLLAISAYVFVSVILGAGKFYAMPEVAKNIFTSIANISLVTSLGKFTPLADSVFWSLPLEIIFYIVYPLAVVPLIKNIKRKSLFILILTLISVNLFFIGLSQSFTHILDLVRLRVFIASYFFWGIALAYFYKDKELFASWTRLVSRYSIIKWLSIIIPVALFCIAYKLLSGANPVYVPYIWSLLVLPISILVLFTFSTETLVAKTFSLKAFTFVGLVSYSLYLSHAFIIRLLKPYFAGVFGDSLLFFTIAVSLAAVSLAAVLFYLVERPYFQKHKNPSFAPKKTIRPVSVKIIKMAIVLSTLLINLIAFYPGVSVLSQVEKCSSEPVITAGNTTTITTTATENRMGIVILNLSFDPTADRHQGIKFAIKKYGDIKWLSETPLSLAYIEPGYLFAFGFPEIENSKDQRYQVSITPEHSVKYHEPVKLLHINQANCLVSYKITKADMLKNPLLIIKSILYRSWLSFSSEQALQAVVLELPLMALLYLAIN